VGQFGFRKLKLVLDLEGTLVASSTKAWKPGGEQHSVTVT
jgi:hypothetical protein